MAIAGRQGPHRDAAHRPHPGAHHRGRLAGAAAAPSGRWWLRISTRSLRMRCMTCNTAWPTFPSCTTTLAGGAAERQAVRARCAGPTGCCPSRTDASGAPCAFLGSGLRARALSPTTAPLRSGRLVEDLLAHHPLAAHLKRLVECDSPDANYEYVRKGLGVSWLPWSVVHADVKSGLLAPAGGKGLEVKFDVRMFRPKRRLERAGRIPGPPFTIALAKRRRGPAQRSRRCRKGWFRCRFGTAAPNRASHNGCSIPIEEITMRPVPSALRRSVFHWAVGALAGLALAPAAFAQAPAYPASPSPSWWDTRRAAAPIDGPHGGHRVVQPPGPARGD